ncbi:mannose-1-phosphate guanylyltransferase [Pseudaestuariivita atlantica]|uniref:mannose-1-phosphate guanylyltransferase n=1 Tax=Pseudaestuariivita atlantica TaxID=1317121 RepID=UPI00067C1E33|nr:sugar phosphate nucleotidyltransferase [Pseudaestuariivita atlantica]
MGALIHPLVICGGNGTRLWPVSRTQSPKQFQRVGGAGTPSFFQSAIDRHRGHGFADPVVVSSARHRDTLHGQLRDIGVNARTILEPMGRNTGPAVLAAAMVLAEDDPDAVMLVVPSDHVIDGDINATIRAMKSAADAGYIITFGIKPRYAETGFGYITDGGPIIEHNGLHAVERFVEKPPTRKARLLVESDIAYWASGISMFSARTIIAEYDKVDPDTVRAVRRSIERAVETEEGLFLDGDSFAECNNAPTESMVFEKTDKIALAPLDVDWSDVGSWTAMYGISESDPAGNVLQGDVIAVETQNTMVRSDNRLVTVVGLTDIIIVDTDDALLVTKVGHCQSVKKVAEHLKKTERVEAEKHAGTETEWGNLRKIVSKDGLDLSALRIKPGAVAKVEAKPGREVIVASGSVTVDDGEQAKTFEAGARHMLPAARDVRIANRGSAYAELIFLTLPVSGEEAMEALRKSNYA